MKKFILAALLPLLYFLYTVFLIPSLAVQATSATAGSYACVLTDTAYFYTARNEKRGLFLLPETYFVKVLSVDGDYCRVEYLYDDAYAKKLTGYAKTSDLTFVDYTPEHPYLYHLFEVRYTIDDAFSDNDDFLSQITVTCAYYGDYKIGSETYCYVLRGDSFGYIPKPDDLTIERSTEYEDNLVVETPPAETDEPSEEDGMPPAQIAILVALCLLVPVLAALILRPPKRPPYDADAE
ncbi:MAG: hypothetical protein IJX91_01170 [Clostridia bacterium]|nr:hypothetical protein [Clostridia bacterium]